MQGMLHHEPPIPEAEAESEWQQYSAADFGADASQASKSIQHSAFLLLQSTHSLEAGVAHVLLGCACMVKHIEV